MGFLRTPTDYQDDHRSHYDQQTASFLEHSNVLFFSFSPRHVASRTVTIFYLPSAGKRSIVATSHAFYPMKKFADCRNFMQENYTVNDQEMKRVIADFLEQGHADTIVALFRSEPKYYTWTGELLQDDRFAVRLGVAVLFEELRALVPDQLPLAIDSLTPLLASPQPNIRGEAISLLAVIGGERAFCLIEQHRDDPHPQVREMVHLVLEDR
jgi:hypothetical protein